MPRAFETTRVLPFHRPIPLTGLPLIGDREHLFPYPSTGDTDPVAVPRTFRMVVLESETLRVEVAPELGGRVYSLHDRRIGREILFSNPVVRPVRIPPVWGFLSGGIEFNFPVSHAPTSLVPVGCAFGRTGDTAWVRVGEREGRTGLEWVVELSLHDAFPGLIQRTAFRNATPAAPRWTSWTIAAVQSTPDTEFVHPPDRVRIHTDRITETGWPGAGWNWDRNHARMTALGWKSGRTPAFGAFHHDLGFGLLHLADPAALPSRKVWTYGHGRHRDWGRATADGRESYCELESSPLPDPGAHPRFPPGTERHHEEYWVPVHDRAACDGGTLPRLDLPPLTDPWLGWHHSPWQSEWEAFRAGAGPLPESPPVTGLDLEDALRRAAASGSDRAAEPLALWLAFHGRPAEALAALSPASRPGACRVAGLLEWRALGRPDRALPLLRQGPLEDPVAVVELDQVLEELGLHGPRQALLDGAPPHRRLTERRAALALAQGRPGDTLRILAGTAWPRELGRGVRTDLWRRARTALDLPPDPVPDVLHEDDLAPAATVESPS